MNATDDPFLYLPHHLSLELLAARYLFIAVAASWLWDCLLSLSDDIRMVEKCGFKLPDMVYFSSRVLTCAYIILAVLFIATPISHCQSMVKAIGWTASFSVAFNNILFFIRVRGVYYRERRVCVVFLVLWFITLSTFTAPFSFTAANIAITSYCVVAEVDTFVASGVVGTALYDTVVFLAISYRLISISIGKSWTDKLRNFVQSKDLAAVSYILWSTGLFYYIPVITMNVFSLIILLMPSVPMTYKSMCPIPEIVLQNILTCRVFRDLKLGYIYNDPANVPTQQTLSIQFAHRARGGEYIDTEEALNSVTTEEESS